MTYLNVSRQHAKHLLRQPLLPSASFCCSGDSCGIPPKMLPQESEQIRNVMGGVSDEALAYVRCCRRHDVIRQGHAKAGGRYQNAA